MSDRADSKKTGKVIFSPEGKYHPLAPDPHLSDRRWPSGRIDRAPVWCSVDLRDGNQALVEPMDTDEKLRMFSELCRIGFKEIEIGFPSASETEYEFTRALIEGGHIPDGVSVQVLVQAREELIRRTFEAVSGAKDIIIHFYNACSEPYRRLVFGKTKEQIIELAVSGARLIRELTEETLARANSGVTDPSRLTRIRYEYSPEFFSGTEPDFAVEICAAVMEALGASEDDPVIINLPSSVQLSTPNIFADQVEYFCRRLPNRGSAVISVHTHNDRGTGIAEAELSLMAGAERVEGTLFGNGERTGNCDIVTLALNMMTQGVAPGLDFSELNRVKRVYEQCTRMHVFERQPYAGELVFTSFSGSHQDAINKGLAALEQDKLRGWEVPYLPVDPSDVGRQYEPIIRINSQSGKGGAAFILHHNFGFVLPRGMHPEFGMMVKRLADERGGELSADSIMELFRREFIDIHVPYALRSHSISDSSGFAGEATATFCGELECHGEVRTITGAGNGPIDAFFDALQSAGVGNYKFVSYSEHAIGEGSDAKAVAYIELRTPNSRNVYGVGIDPNINLASIKGVLCAVNRALLHDQ